MARPSTSACRSATPNSAWWPTVTLADAPQRILLNVNVADLGIGDVDGLLEHVETLGGRVLGPPSNMPWGQRVAHIQDPDGNTVNLTEPI